MITAKEALELRELLTPGERDAIMMNAIKNDFKDPNAPRMSKKDITVASILDFLDASIRYFATRGSDTVGLFTAALHGRYSKFTDSEFHADIGVKLESLGYRVQYRDDVMLIHFGGSK